MSIFGAIMDKIFHRHKDAPGQSAPTVATGAPAPASQAHVPAPGQTPAPAAPAAPAQSATPVDVEGVLVHLAQSKGGGGNWRTSIVDLLKLLDLDSSLDARKQLGQELGVHAGADGSAEQNIALQKAVWKKLAENGGKVPDSLKD